MRVKQPSGVVQMTNVAIIKYKTKQTKLEIVCYKNKVFDWRSGVEKNLDEVLQIKEIYTNATKGDVAPIQELNMLFGGKSKDDMIKIILEKGDLQISDKERDTTLSQAHKDIIKFIQEKCVHSISEKPLTMQSIEYAISKVNYIIKTDQNVKKQALQCIKELKQQFFIKRAAMKISVSFQEGDKQKILQIFNDLDLNLVEEINSKFIIITDPAVFRPLSQALVEKVPKHAIEVVEAIIKSKIEGLDDVGAVELEMRKEPIQISDSEEEEGDQKKPKNKKQKRLAQQKQQQIQQLHKEEQEQEQQVQQKQKQQQHVITNNTNDLMQKQFKCTTCTISFDTNPEFRAHYKTDWHNYNMKQKSSGKQALSRETFLELELDESMKKLRAPFCSVQFQQLQSDWSTFKSEAAARKEPITDKKVHLLAKHLMLLGDLEMQYLLSILRERALQKKKFTQSTQEKDHGTWPVAHTQWLQYQENLQKLWPIGQNNAAAAFCDTLGFGGGISTGDAPVEAKVEQVTVAKVEEKTSYDVELSNIDPAQKIKIIKEVRAIFNLGLKEAKDLVEKAPAVLQKGLKKDDADALKAKLESFGCTISLI